jgi:predicted ferric reductase
MYEIFLRSHLLASVAFLVLLWFHISRLDTHILVCLVTSGSLFVLQRLSWLLSFIYHNFGSGPSRQVLITKFHQSGLNEDVLHVRINLKRPWRIRAGQYIYLSLPGLRALGLGILEAHPFMIAWPLYNEQERLSSIVLLVQSCRGFTRRLQLFGSLNPGWIDGPYGGADEDTLANYDKVLLMSYGIGLAAHLCTARYLLLAHNRQTARVRRLTLVWILETQGTKLRCTDEMFALTESLEQMRWAEEFLCALDDLDPRHILTIFLVYPSKVEGSSEGRVTSFQLPGARMLPLHGTLDMTWLIESEWGAEAGNMLVSGKL